MATIIGANIYTDGLKRNEYPVSLTGTFNLKAWYNPEDNVSVEATLIYDDGTEGPKSNIVEFQLTSIQFDPLYQVVLDHATTEGITTPTSQQNIHNDNIVRTLRSEGLLLDNDLFYYFEQDDAALYEFCTLNWMNPSQFKLTNAGAVDVSFVPGFGFKVDTGVKNQYFNTGFVPSTHAVHSTSTSASTTFKGFDMPASTYGSRIAGAVSSSGHILISRTSPSDLTVRLYSTDGQAKATTYNSAKMNSQTIITRDDIEIKAYNEGGLEFQKDVPPSGLPSTELHLFGTNTNGTIDANSSIFGLRYFMLGAFRSPEQQLKLYSIFGGNNTIYTKTTDGVLKFDLDDTQLEGIYYPQVVPSSKFPTLNTSKDYIVIYSTDHSKPDETSGAVAWGEADNEALDGFIERGVIVSGWQSETGWIELVENDPDGEVIHLYFHPSQEHPDSGGFQQTRLLTRAGGDLHDPTGWTDRGVVIQVIDPYATENHTGYLATFLQDDGTLVGIHHTKGNSGNTVDKINRFGKSTSADGRVWVRETSYIDNTSFMPNGRLFHMSPAYFFERSGQQYALGLSMDYSYSQGGRNIAICKSVNYLPDEFIIDIASADGGNAAKIAGYYINPASPDVLNVYYTKDSTALFHATWDLSQLD